jgi:hypothetical protein
MKRAILAVLVMMMWWVAPLHAQEQNNFLYHAKTEAEAARFTDSVLFASDLYHGIVLTEDQKDAVRDIQKRYKPLKDQINAEGGGAAVILRKYMALSIQKYTDVREYLTPDQQKIYDGNVVKMRKRQEAILKEKEGKSFSAPTPQPADSTSAK